MISQNSIQQILSRIDIVDIVGSFVKLKKRGANYLGLCPFHNEKSPSFTVSPGKEIYKCFGCGASGNSISFIMEHEKYSYVEALRWLAQRYQIELEETEVSPEVKQYQLMADSLFIINNYAREYFTDTLFNKEEGQNIGLSYFEERGFTEETIKKFQLGYCLNTFDAFAKSALEKGYNLEYLQKTGLVTIRNDQPADNYRGRVIFPIHNQSGKILGFGARILGAKSDRAPKYINSPENEIYVKSRVLYGTYFARHAIDKQNECLLVEGYTDVISLHQAGVENVVASSGTSLTQDQLRLIKKYTNNLTILYDGDSAGVKAALRGLDMAIEEGLNVKLVLLPDKEDPDSYVQKIGAAAFREFIQEHKQDFVLFKLQLSMQEAGSDSTKKSQLVNEIAETISKIDKAEDFTRQQDYIRQCSQLLHIDEQGLIQLVNKFIRDRLVKREQAHARNQPATDDDALSEEAIAAMEAAETGISVESLLNGHERQEKELVKILLRFGDKPFSEEENSTVADYVFHLPYDFEALAESELVKRILREYKALYDAGNLQDKRWFLYHEDQALSKQIANILEDKEADLSINWKDRFEIDTVYGDNAYLRDTISTTNYLILRKIKKLIHENQEEAKKATEMDQIIACLEMQKHLNALEKELTNGMGTVIFK
ncbi:DNA primase [Chitinophaga polysaccharea]|uniref:DNA primase n=1 Tax=Chitinophaga TaxID=79328 RepID=UPI001455563F|nr:DNA primase [Chitinophaga sp. Ak27]NLR57237.1 DNA primase [Chitinophaga polysaccharea]NLU91645.1 DNA primase [Chitinophaga sp. Ak27]